MEILALIGCIAIAAFIWMTVSFAINKRYVNDICHVLRHAGRPDLAEQLQDGLCQSGGPYWALVMQSRKAGISAVNAALAMLDFDAINHQEEPL